MALDWSVVSSIVHLGARTSYPLSERYGRHAPSMLATFYRWDIRHR